MRYQYLLFRRSSPVFWVARSSLTFKREIPWCTTWSPDGSLLAVAFGTYVAICDPSSNAIIRALTASELRGRICSISFLGDDGRFLAVAGVSDVVLWDLIKQKGMLFSLSLFTKANLCTSPMAPSGCSTDQCCCHSSQG